MIFQTDPIIIEINLEALYGILTFVCLMLAGMGGLWWLPKVVIRAEGK